MTESSMRDLEFVVSSRCTSGDCVQVAPVDGGTSIALRDSKNPGSVLLFSAQEWRDFLGGVNRGEFV
ncbi:DUF397 domain-containing protein [Actinoplanes sp. NPDC049265]|uniref:DUF397 domain-containing protein n=1 Tax=Actinoplanes sp. NPDC049265 TaxID=3363902 RepID=UPI0037171929